MNLRWQIGIMFGQTGKRLKKPKALKPCTLYMDYKQGPTLTATALTGNLVDMLYDVRVRFLTPYAMVLEGKEELPNGRDYRYQEWYCVPIPEETR